MTPEDMKRVTGEELNSRMVYLKPSAERIANLQREKESGDRQLFGMLVVVAAAIVVLMVTR